MPHIEESLPHIYGILSFASYKLPLLLKLKTKGFQVVLKRWIVERTFGWFQWDRRLMIDYERQSCSAETMLYIASIGKMLRRYK